MPPLEAGLPQQPIPVLVRLRLLKRVLEAPKLLYCVHKMDVFQDGVWVEYTLTNLSSGRKYLTPMFLDFPIGYMRAYGPDKRQWRIPQFTGNVQFKNPDTFIGIEPGGSLKFRSQISFIARKPLELVKQEVPRVAQPNELAYLIYGWSNASYSNLDARREEQVPTFTFGIGKVPVTWHTQKSPITWNTHTRLYE
jgi:hypothetical protein